MYLPSFYVTKTLGKEHQETPMEKRKKRQVAPQLASIICSPSCWIIPEIAIQCAELRFPPGHAGTPKNKEDISIRKISKFI